MTPLQRLYGGYLPKLVIFDLDGTLVDSVPDLAAAVDTMLARRGLAPAGVEQVRDWVGNGAEVLVRRALAGQMEHAAVAPALAADALAEFLQLYADKHSLTSVYPGVMQLLKGLTERGVKLALITNKPAQFLPELLTQTGLAEFFHWVVGGDTFTVKKPDPAALIWVMQQAAVSADQTLFVGDSRNDVLAARAAGVAMLAVSYGYNHGQPIAMEKPDLLVDSLDLLI